MVSPVWNLRIKPLMASAWDIAVPRMSDSFGRDGDDEGFEVAQCFRGRHWDEVDCSQIPLWFSPLSYLPDDLAGYYLASIIKCLCITESDSAYYYANFIELFLHRETGDSGSSRLTSMQRSALIVTLPLILDCEYRQFFSDDVDEIFDAFRFYLKQKIPNE